MGAAYRYGIVGTMYVCGCVWWRVKAEQSMHARAAPVFPISPPACVTRAPAAALHAMPIRRPGQDHTPVVMLHFFAHRRDATPARGTRRGRVCVLQLPTQQGCGALVRLCHRAGRGGGCNAISPAKGSLAKPDWHAACDDRPAWEEPQKSSCNRKVYREGRTLGSTEGGGLRRWHQGAGRSWCDLLR